MPHLLIRTQEVRSIDKRKIFAFLAPALIVLAAAFAVTLTVNSAVTPVAASDTVMSNVTLMINDFMPAFMQIMIVMIFVLLLLTIVDRVGKRI